ncbi:MAG TPA: chromate transporter [Ktedonobacteraceae bacterium]
MINPLTYFLLFLKGSLFSSGGTSNLPSVHQDLLARHWANDTQFGESVVIGQLTPGPNGLWVISIGYLTYGILGAVLALVAITIPPLLVLAIAATYHRIEHLHWVPGLMRGISLSVAGIQIAACWSIIRQQGADWRTWLIGIAAVGLILSRRINFFIIVALAGIAGYFLFR